MLKNNSLFDEDELKNKLKVVIVGYGEKRDKRVNIALEETIRNKANKKCEQLGISLSECVNQLLYIWAKDVDLNLSDEEQQLNLFSKDKGE
jgi:antitoxin component of RelBE/YafQ-DinJ toxin-antitoxin module